MVTLQINGQSHTIDAPGRHAVALGAARYRRPHRHKIRLRHRPVRRLHRASGRQGGALLPAAGRLHRQPRHHHHRGGRRHPQRRQDPEGLARHRSGAMRLLPVRPDHVGDGACSTARPIRTIPTSMRRWRAISAAAAPMCASVRRSKTPPKRLKREHSCPACRNRRSVAAQFPQSRHRRGRRADAGLPGRRRVRPGKKGGRRSGRASARQICPQSQRLHRHRAGRQSLVPDSAGGNGPGRLYLAFAIAGRRTGCRFRQCDAAARAADRRDLWQPALAPHVHRRFDLDPRLLHRAAPGRRLGPRHDGAGGRAAMESRSRHACGPKAAR